MSVDLRKCKKGDILVHSDGTTCTYVEHVNPGGIMPHKIKYHDYDNCFGLRTDAGYFFIDGSDDRYNIIRIERLKKPKKKINQDEYIWTVERFEEGVKRWYIWGRWRSRYDAYRENRTMKADHPSMKFRVCKFVRA